MLIGIDASKAASEKKTGVENFVFELILHLSKIDQKNIYYLFTDQHLPKELLANPNFQEIFIPFPKFWNKFRLPLALLKYKTDLYLQPSYMIPTFAPKKSIAILHDIAWLKFPEAYSKKELLFQKLTLEHNIKKSAQLICVSKSAETDLIQYNNSAKNKTKVIYLAADENVKPVKSPKDVLKINSKYFLSMGRLEIRKNTQNIVKAFNLFKKNGFSQKLVLAGKPGYGFEEIQKEINASEYSKDIIIPGFIPAEMTNDLLCGADAFIYPSLYEGFGISALEAMQAGTPVITSNISSLPEVVNDAAILLDPTNVNAIADAMKSIAQNDNLKSELAQKGIKQAQKFNWNKTAQEYLKAMEQL